MRYGFGVDLGGTTVKIAYFDEQGTMISKWEIPTVTADGGKQILPDIAASIRQFIEQKTIDPATIIGVGIGVPGLALYPETVDSLAEFRHRLVQTGRLLWKDFQLHPYPGGSQYRSPS